MALPTDKRLGNKEGGEVQGTAGRTGAWARTHAGGSPRSQQGCRRWNGSRCLSASPLPGVPQSDAGCQAIANKRPHQVSRNMWAHPRPAWGRPPATLHTHMPDPAPTREPSSETQGLPPGRWPRARCCSRPGQVQAHRWSGLEPCLSLAQQPTAQGALSLLSVYCKNETKALSWSCPGDQGAQNCLL